MKFSVVEDLVFNEPLPNGRDTKIILKKGTIVSYASPSQMSNADRQWYETFLKRNNHPIIRTTVKGPQRIIPFTWRGKVRYANSPEDLVAATSGGIVSRF